MILLLASWGQGLAANIADNEILFSFSEARLDLSEQFYFDIVEDSEHSEEFLADKDKANTLESGEEEEQEEEEDGHSFIINFSDEKDLSALPPRLSGSDPKIRFQKNRKLFVLFHCWKSFLV